MTGFSSQITSLFFLQEPFVHFLFRSVDPERGRRGVAQNGSISFATNPINLCARWDSVNHRLIALANNFWNIGQIKNIPRLRDSHPLQDPRGCS